MTYAEIAGIISVLHYLPDIAITIVLFLSVALMGTGEKGPGYLNLLLVILIIIAPVLMARPWRKNKTV